MENKDFSKFNYFLKFKITYEPIHFKEATFSAAVKQRVLELWCIIERKNVIAQHMVLLEQNATALKEQRGMLLFPTTLPQDWM